MCPIVFCAVLALSPPDVAMNNSAQAAEHAPATIRVNLPADAKLTFDGQATWSSSANRLFATPALERGKRFHYSLRAEIVRAGQMVAVQRDIQVQAGQETFVNMQIPGEGLGDCRFRGVYGAWPGVRSYDRLEAAKSSAGSRALISLSGQPVSTGGFVPSHWGPDPSDPFFINSGH